MRKKKLLIISAIIISLTLILAGCDNSSPSAIDNTYTISGQVQNLSEEGIEDVKINVEESSKTVTTDSEGKWTLTNLSGEVTLKPAKNNYSFEPVQKIVSGSKSEITFKAQQNESFYKVGLVTNENGLEAKRNSLVAQGLNEAKNDFGIETDIIESNSTDEYINNLNNFIDEDYDMVWAVGSSMQKAVSKAAQNHPDVKFGIIDGVVEEPNVVSGIFKEEEGSFLSGVIAAMKSDSMATGTNKIGFIGAYENAIEAFEAGYRYGVVNSNSGVEVVSEYTNTFDDPSQGEAAADNLYENENVDVIYQAAGNCGKGVIESASKHDNKYAIGVDYPQNELAPNSVLTSMVKKFDNVIYSEVENLVSDKFNSGIKRYGLKEDGVGLYMPQAEDMLSQDQDILDKVVDYKNKIINQEIDVPVSPEVNLSINTEGDGSVSKSLEGPYKIADMIKLEADPAADWTFGSWELTTPNEETAIRENPLNGVLKEKDYTVNAIFGQIEFVDDFITEANSWTMYNENTNIEELNYTSDNQLESKITSLLDDQNESISLFYPTNPPIQPNGDFLINTKFDSVSDSGGFAVYLGPSDIEAAAEFYTLQINEAAEEFYLYHVDSNLKDGVETVDHVSLDNINHDSNDNVIIIKEGQNINTYINSSKISSMTINTNVIEEIKFETVAKDTPVTNNIESIGVLELQ